jgi:eukaryotic-like serine/threonine-protein kinase
VRCARPDARGDLYSWAASLYEVLAGRSYLGDALLSPYDLRVAIVERPPDLPIRKIPGELNAILAACLAKDPAGRPANVAEVARRLSAVTPGAGRRRSTAL